MTPGRIVRNFVVAAIALASIGAPSLRAGGKKDAQINTQELVWPLPPDKPRYRWIEVIQDLKQYDAKGKTSMFDRLIGDNSKMGPEGLYRPIGVATDSKNRIIIVGQLKKTVYIIDKEHKQITRIYGASSMKLQSPIGVTTDDHDNIFVADAKLHSVMRFAPDGHATGSFGQADGLVNPTYMAVDSVRRRLYVVDSHNHQVLVYNVDTLQLMSKFGKPGTKKGEFGYPIGIAVSPKDGTVAVTNTRSCSVEIFTPEFKWVRSIGQCGDAIGDFTRPKGAAYDSEGNLYVVDNAFNHFQIFDEKGHLRMWVGATGTAPGTFYQPNAIYIDRNNRIYVTEFFGNRLQVFQFLGSN